MKQVYKKNLFTENMYDILKIDDICVLEILNTSNVCTYDKTVSTTI
jgi:hypothetical protein